MWERDTQAAKDVAGSGAAAAAASAGAGGGGGFHIIHYRCPLQRAVATAPSEGGPTAMATRFSWCVPCAVCVCVCAGISFV